MEPLVKLQTAEAQRECSRGKALRAIVPRSSHADWSAPLDRANPLETLEKSSARRLKYLLPVKNARMYESAFAFYRGSSIVMAADLANTPSSGLTVELCGDAHCSNFGGFATPERNTIFDLNDFDETLGGPWEWDVKRLVTSFVLAGRHNNLSERQTEASVLAAASAYRRRMWQLASLSALEVWYSRLDATKILNEAKRADLRGTADRIVVEAATSSIEAAIEKLTVTVAGQLRFQDDPPKLFHSSETEQSGFDIEHILREYEGTLSHDVRRLLKRYKLTDSAIKVVGVGSVGTRCGIALLVADDNDALLLQIKEATRSVLEPYLQRSPYENQGERVVRGQRMMQSASDMFLGWASSGEHDFYVRQFKDMKASAALDDVTGAQLAEYAQYCGFALAAGHARSGSPAAIAGYLGRGPALDRAVLQFGMAYAEQSQSDYAAFGEAIEAGAIDVAEDAA